MLRSISILPPQITPTKPAKQTIPQTSLHPSATSLQFGAKEQDELTPQDKQLRQMPLVWKLQARNPQFVRLFAQKIKQKYGSYNAPVFHNQATLLHISTLYCSPSVVETLLRLGCQPTRKDKKQRQPIDWLNDPDNQQTEQHKAQIRHLLKNPPPVEEQPSWPGLISNIAQSFNRLWNGMPIPKLTTKSAVEGQKDELETLRQQNLALQTKFFQFGIYLYRLNQKLQSKKNQSKILKLTANSAARNLKKAHTELELRNGQALRLLEAYEGLTQRLETQQTEIETLNREKKELETAQLDQSKKNKSLSDQNRTFKKQRDKLEERIKVLKANQDRNGHLITRFMEETSQKKLLLEQQTPETERLLNTQRFIKSQLQAALESDTTLEDLQQSLEALLAEIQTPEPEEVDPIPGDAASLPDEEVTAGKMPAPNRQRADSWSFSTTNTLP